jgi:late competence protein required for DNA uptake (superfamily II DNA/RNA helicase)
MTAERFQVARLRPVPRTDPRWRPHRGGAVRTLAEASRCARCGLIAAQADGGWFHCRQCAVYWRVEVSAFGALYVSPSYAHPSTDCRCIPTQEEKNAA